MGENARTTHAACHRTPSRLEDLDPPWTAELWPEGGREWRFLVPEQQRRFYDLGAVAWLKNEEVRSEANLICVLLTL